MFIAATFGAAIGLIGARLTMLGAWTLVPWALGGVVVGYLARRRPVAAGAAYGFVLSFTFMLGVYTGKASVLSRTPFFALLGIVGAVCGATFAAGGRWLARRMAASRTPSTMPPETR